jgi:hypothetical protein
MPRFRGDHHTTLFPLLHHGTHAPLVFGDRQQDYHSAVVPPSNVGQTSVVPESSANPSARSHPNLPSSRSSVVSPQPLRPLDRKPSSGGPRNRSPSSSTAFSDLAQHGIYVFTNCATVALTKCQ